jgi:hypothetical protein
MSEETTKQALRIIAEFILAIKATRQNHPTWKERNAAEYKLNDVIKEATQFIDKHL